MTKKHAIEKTDAEWRAELTPEQYKVMREKGTERAFTGAYVDNHDKGMYKCAACGEPLFDSDTKFESGSGWPSFFKPLSADAVETEDDRTHGMRRTEVMCKRCGRIHLGALSACQRKNRRRPSDPTRKTQPPKRQPPCRWLISAAKATVDIGDLPVSEDASAVATGPDARTPQRAILDELDGR